MTGQDRNNALYSWTGHVDLDRPYAANGLNQYTSAGPATFAYDANGNLTSDGASTYVYDAENRLVSASGATSAQLRYDPLGRLYETSGGAAGTTRFLYDGDQLVAEYKGSGTMLRRYAHAVGTDTPLIWYEGSGGTARRWLYDRRFQPSVGSASSAQLDSAATPEQAWMFGTGMRSEVHLDGVEHAAQQPFYLAFTDGWGDEDVVKCTPIEREFRDRRFSPPLSIEGRFLRGGKDTAFDRAFLYDRFSEGPWRPPAGEVNIGILVDEDESKNPEVRNLQLVFWATVFPTREDAERAREALRP